jgi:hypothetical protein
MRTSLRRFGQLVLGLLIALLLLAGPAFVLFLFHASWAEGYRLENWGYLKGASFRYFFLMALVWFRCILVLLGVLKTRLVLNWKKRPWRPTCIYIFALFLVLFTLTATITSLFGIFRPSQAFAKGRQAVEMEIGLENLARQGIALYKQMPETQTIVTDHGHDPSLPPAIQRFRPAWVAKWPGKLHIELHGGFDHYGYQFQLDVHRRVWVLQWFTENSEEERLTIPAD